MNPVYESNLKIIQDTIACKNEKPTSCYTGDAAAAVMAGLTVADFLEEPVKGAKAFFDTVKRLQEDAGPIHSFNGGAGAMNMAIGISALWNSKVLIPGKDISANSIWQVKEQKLVGPEAYDEILTMGYNTFIQEKIYPQIFDFECLGYYMGYAEEHDAEVVQMHDEIGIPAVQVGIAVNVPFEQLCGMRSMSQFYMDCYKRLDKLKEVSDFIFAENTAQMEEELTAVENNPYWMGAWVGGWRTAPSLINPKIWNTLVWPYMKASGEQLLRHGKVPVFHLDQNWDREIEHFAELPAGKIVLNTDGMTNLPSTRKVLPGVALMGDVPPPLLTTGTPQQVTDYVNKLIDEVGPQGLFVCPGCDCPVSAKYENVVAMIKATNEWH